jgi:transcription initiation factor IIE alpha subunit
MSRYTPKHRKPTGEKAARPKGRSKAKAPAKKTKTAAKKRAKPGAFVCEICQKAYRTEEALATHATDAHGKEVDPAAMTPVAPNMVRCPECGAPVRKRNLQHHLRFVHDTV